MISYWFKPDSLLYPQKSVFCSDSGRLLWLLAIGYWLLAIGYWLFGKWLMLMAGGS
jgi:hypothetical protein